MTGVELREFALDLATPLSTARGEVARRRGLLVGVERDGVRGVGEATPLSGWTESFAACRRALDGADGDALPDVRDAPAARHGLELARLDADARRRGVSLADALADGGATTVPVNATVGDASPAETAKAVRTAADRGFDCVKVKVGVGGVDRDVERLRAARAADADATLRADANGAWDRETAARAVEAFAPLDLAYVEQPLPASDLDGHRTLRGRGVAVALDETLAAHPIGRVLDADAADVVVLKPMALGGPVRTVETARRARDAGVEPVVTTTVDAVVARTAAVHVAAAVPDVAPCGLATADLLGDDLAPDPAPVEGGEVRVPDGPGLAGAAFADLV